MRLALGGIPAGRYRAEGDDIAHDIRVVLARKDTPELDGAPRAGLEILDDVFLPTSTGGAMPLAAVAELIFEPSPTTIRHFDGSRSTTVTAFTQTGFNTDRVT